MFTEDRVHTIVDFLKRPRNIDTVQWLSTTPSFTLLATYNIPDVTVASRSIACKCSDFRFWRWTTTFEFVINVNRFSIGMLIAVLVPFPSLTGGNENLQSLTALTAYPHVFIDAGSAPTAKFTVPYVGRRAAYDSMSDLITPWAAVHLYVFNQLNGTTGSTSAYVTTFVYCSDISTAIPVWNDVAPFGPPSALRPKAQMNTEAERDSVVGSLTTRTQRAAKTAVSVAKAGAGVLKDLGAAANWVKELAPGLLTAAGFSKPTNLELNDSMIQQPAKGLCSFNFTDNSVPLCANYKNSLSINQEIFGTKTDEMDIKYVASKPTWLERVNWPDTAQPGQVLATYPVTPGFCGSASNLEVLTTLLGYVAHMFRLWRGDLCWKLQFVANQFYSGRVALAFYSGLTTLDIPPFIAFDEVDMVPKVYCDIKNSTDCTFTVPYAMHVPYLQTRIASRTSTGTNFTFASLDTLNVSQGTLVLFVVNPLVHPATVPSTIPINVFVYGGPNIEFQIPSFDSYVPVAAVPPPPLSISGKEEDEEKIIAHSNSVPEKLNVTAATGRGEHTMLVSKSLHTSVFAEASIGESVTSFRELIKMFSITVTDVVGGNRSLTVDPAYFGLDEDTTANCALFRVSRLYAFWKGSRRYKFLPRILDPASFPVFYVVTVSAGATVPSPPNFATPQNNAGSLGFSWFANLAQTPIIEVSAPFYTKDYLGVVSDTTGPLRSLVRIWYIGSDDVEISVYDAAGDDFTFGWLKAPPNLRLYN